VLRGGFLLLVVIFQQRIASAVPQALGDQGGT